MSSLNNINNNNFNSYLTHLSGYENLPADQLVMTTTDHTEIKNLIFSYLTDKDLFNVSLTCKGCSNIATDILGRRKKEEQIQKFFKLNEPDISKQDLRNQLVFSKREIFERYRKFLLELKNDLGNTDIFRCYFVKEETNEVYVALAAQNSSYEEELDSFDEALGEKAEGEFFISDLENLINKNYCLIVPKFVWEPTPNEFMGANKCKKETQGLSISYSELFDIPNTEISIRVGGTTFSDFIRLFNPLYHQCDKKRKQDSSDQSENK